MRKRSRTHQIILTSFAIVSLQFGVARAQAQQDFSAELSRAETLYRGAQFPESLIVLALDSEHLLAREYSDLAQQRLVLLADRGYMEWRTSFDARQFDKAAAAYNKIRGDPQLNTLKLADRIQSEYQKALSDLVDSWKAACAARTLTRLSTILNEARSVASGLPFGRDALNQLQPCPPAGTAQVAASNPVKTPSPARPSSVVVTNPAPPANAASAPRGQAPGGHTPSSCIQGDPVLA